MARARCERGQAAVGYGGVLAVLALVFLALFSLGLEREVSAGVRQAVCSVLSGADCGEPLPNAHGYADDPYEDTGDAEREIYDAECTDDGGDDPARGNGDDPVGDEQVDEAYGNLGRVYDYYADRFGHDSYDGEGAPVVGTVNFCRVAGVAGGSSFWDGDEINFAPGAGDALDTAAHEFTHGVIQETADLDYECQSGALNESIADMIAWNLDPEDTTYGEDRDSGAIRDYRDPTLHGQPGHVDDYEASANDQAGDWGGVHTNSGIPNRAYYLIVRNIGRERAEQVLWRALTEHLEHDSGFEDYRTAMLAAAQELYGPGEHVEGVDAAFAAVGLDGTWEAPEQEGC